MKDMIKEYNCMNCDEEINSETHVVFCNEACLKEYISDLADLEKFLIKQKEQEEDL
ncbi:MAG: hypothetical protein K0S93_168 [Nitrososphaeraceae archaeon]|jgi:hypothetical protein|nr:hypothetical protein [Nitrososphaeraceae archaeon]